MLMSKGVVAITKSPSFNPVLNLVGKMLEVPGCARDSLDEPPQRKRKLETPVKESSSSDVKHGLDVKDSGGYCGVKAIGCTPADELIAKVALHCYNSHKGTNLQLMTVTELMLEAVAHFNYYMTLDAIDPSNNTFHSIEIGVWDAALESHCNLGLVTTFCIPKGSEESGSLWDPNGVDSRYNGVMPKWLDDDALTGTEKLQYYEVNESDLQDNEWLHLYAQVAAYSKWIIDLVDHLPLEINRVVVQTKEEDIESRLKLKSSNAIFYITFKTRGGAECACIVRQTRDGRPQHMCLEVKNVEMDK